MKLRALLALLFAAPALLSAQIEPVGGDFQVNLYTTFPQSSPKVSRAPDGRFAVVWASAYQDGTVSGVYGRVFAADGTPVTGEIQLSQHTASHPIDPAVAMMDDGSFVAVWENRTDGTGPIYSGIEGRRFAADGMPLGGDFVVHPLNPTKGSHRPVIATNGRGGFVVAWEEGSFDTDVFARIFGPDGQPLAPSFQVNQGETYAVQDQPSVAMGPAGEVVIVWRSNDTFVGFHEEGNQVVYLQRFKADGTRRDGEVALSERVRRPVYAPRVAKDASGNFLVVWTEYVSPTATVYGRRFAQNGTPLGGRLTLLREVVPEAIAMDDHGGFVLVWTRSGEDRALDIFARRFSAFGTPEGPEVRVNAHAPRMQYTPVVAVGPGGSFVAAWSSDQQDGDNLGVFARLFEAPEAPGDADLFLLDGRFRVTATWRDFRGRSGVGRAIPLTANTGALWFFDSDNLELMVKILDARSSNGHFWIFYGAMSNVEYVLTVLDTATGESRSYYNPRRHFASRGDTRGLPNVQAFQTDGLATGSRAPEPAISTGQTAAACAGAGEALCLNNGRFRVEATWRDFQGHTGIGHPHPLTDDTGALWFFGSENLELAVKVLDGRANNGHFWVFYGSLTNVEFTLTVTDTVTGNRKTYTNPLRRFASVGDTRALPAE